MSVDRRPGGAAGAPAGSDTPDAWVVTVDLAFLRSVLRRRRLLLIALAALGALLGAGAAVATSTGSVAVTTLLLAQDPSQDPDSAAATDLGLLGTRTLAERVVSDGDLPLTAEELQGAVSVHRSSGQLLSLAVAADDDADAVARADVLAQVFLELRAEVLSRQSGALISQYEARAAELEAESARLTDEITQLAVSDPTNTQRLNELLAERSGATGRAADLRQAVESERDRVASVVEASQIVDPAAVEPRGSRVTLALLVVTGAIGAFSLGAALFIAIEIFNNRPRQRADVAEAIGAPVLMSVGLLSRRPRARRDRALVTERLQARLCRTGGRAGGLALLGVDDDADTVRVAAHLIRSISGDGHVLTVVDLSRQRRLSRSLRRATASIPGVHIVRPHLTPSDEPAEPAEDVLAVADQPAGETTGPAAESSHDAAADDGARGRYGRAPTRAMTGRSDAEAVIVGSGPETPRSFSLVVGSVDPAVGSDSVDRWADEAVLVIRAGRATRERLATAARLVRGAGVPIWAAVLTGSDRTDDSIGDPDDTTGLFTTLDAVTWR